MEVIEWANGNGQTLKITPPEAEALEEALKEACAFGRGSAVMEHKEIEVEVV